MRNRQEENLQNTFSGYMLTTSIEPYFLLSWSKAKWEIRFPLSMLDMNFKNVAEDIQYKHDKPYANIRTNLSLYLPHGWKIFVSGGKRLTYGNINNFVTAPVYYTYKDATTTGTGVLDCRNSLYGSCNINYHNTMQAFFFSLMANISHSSTNRMNSKTVTDGSVYSIISDRKNTMDDKMVTFNIGKHIRSLNNSISFVAAAGNTKTNILSKNNVVSLTNNRFQIETKVDQTLLSEKLNLILQYSYYHTNNKVQDVGSKMNQHNIDCSLSYFITKSLELFGDFTYSKIKDEYMRKNETNANAGLRFIYKKTELELKATNLTNQKDYVINRQVGEYNYHYQYDLRPLACLLSVKYNY